MANQELPASEAANFKPADDAPTHGEEITDPTAAGNFVPNDPAAAATPGQHPNSTPTLPMDDMPFGDQASLASMSNINEYKLYLGHRYGDKNVVTDFDSDGNPNLIVDTGDGKKYRIGPPGGKDGPSFIATIAGATPEIVGGMIGGTLGAVAGPAGAVAGAGLGAMAGKAYTQGVKGVTGNYDETAAEGVNNLGVAGVEGMSGEMGGQIIGKGVAKTLTGSLPKFFTGATDDSIGQSKRALNAGAIPSFRSHAPKMTHLARIEVLDEKLSGRNIKADELNMGYVKQHLREKLTDNGYPRAHVDEFLGTLDGQELAVSNQNVGEQLKTSVEAHVKAMTDSIDQSAKVADTHIDSQLATITKGIDDSKSSDLAAEFGASYESAYKDFTTSAGKLYDNAFISKKPVVPMDKVSQAAKKIVDEIREASPTQVKALQKELSERTGKQMTEEDAILMSEFGVEIPANGEKITLQAAQRLRTALKEKAGYGQFRVNSNQRDYGEIERSLNDAMHDAAGDPELKTQVAALDKADSFWRENIRKFDSAKMDNLIKTIKNGESPDPDKLVKMIAGSGSSARINKLKAVVGPETWSKVQAADMSRYLRSVGVRDLSGVSKVDGYKMLGDLEDGDRVISMRAVHGPEAIGQLRELAKMIATRRGTLDPAVLKTGDVKTALQKMKAAEAVRDEWMSRNALRVLADPNKTGEEAYQYLARGHGNGGNENRIQAVVDTFGKNSGQVLALRQAMLEEIARNAKISSLVDQGSSGLDKAMKQYSKSQLDNVFPPGFASDMHQLSKVMRFMFPEGSADTAMAGQEAGAIQSHRTAFIKRVYRIQVASLVRFIVMHPAVVKTLVLGREEGEEAWMRGTAELFKKMAKAETQVGNEQLDNDNLSPQDKGGAPNPQPPTAMPGPGTIQ